MTVHAREVSWRGHERDLSSLRRTVFVHEQGVAEDEEWDGADPECRHFLAEDGNGLAIGTARLMPSGQIGRMAVLREWRGQGIGARLLKLAVDAARAANCPSVFLHAQSHAVGFYERAGFKATGKPFMEAGIEHCEMTLPSYPTHVRLPPWATRAGFKATGKPFMEAGIEHREMTLPRRGDPCGRPSRTCRLAEQRDGTSPSPTIRCSLRVRHPTHSKFTKGLSYT